MGKNTCPCYNCGKIYTLSVALILILVLLAWSHYSLIPFMMLPLNSLNVYGCNDQFSACFSNAGKDADAQYNCRVSFVDCTLSIPRGIVANSIIAHVFSYIYLAGLIIYAVKIFPEIYVGKRQPRSNESCHFGLIVVLIFSALALCALAFIWTSTLQNTVCTAYENADFPTTNSLNAGAAIPPASASDQSKLNQKAMQCQASYNQGIEANGIIIQLIIYGVLLALGGMFVTVAIFRGKSKTT